MHQIPTHKHLDDKIFIDFGIRIHRGEPVQYDGLSALSGIAS